MRKVLGLVLAVAPIASAAGSDFSCTWTTGTSSTWNVAGNWSNCNSTFPNNSAQTFDATIAAAGTYTVTLNSNVSLNNLTINAAGATLSQTANTLTMAPGGVISILSGAYQLNGGKISGGTIQQTGTNGLRFGNNTGNTLDGVTVLGDLNLNNGSFNKVQISNGLTLRNEANTGNGVANLDNTAILAFAGTQTFNNATVNVSSSSGLTVEQSGATLTLGSGVLVQGTGGIGAAQLNGAPVSLINQGILRGNVSGQSLTIGNSNLTLTNAAGATIEAVGGGIVIIGATALTNAGTINVGAGSLLRLSATNLTNTGTVNVLTGTSTLTLDGTTTTAALANFNNTAGGTFNLTGTLTNTADTLTLGGHLGTITLVGGTINGGIVQEAATNGLRFANNTGNTLDGVTVLGDLNLNNGSFNKVQISNGLTLRNEANTGNGVANLDNTAILAFAGTQTFNNATVNVSSSSGLTVEQSGATLTLGSGVLVQGTGGIGAAQLNGAPVSLINQGILRGNVSGQSLTIGNSNLTLTNAAGATIEAVGGGIVIIGATALTNAGTINVGTGSLLRLSATNLTNTGTVNVLTGTSTLTLDGTTTTAGLANFNNTAGGTFNLTGTLTNTADTLTLGGHLGTITLVGGAINGGIVQEAATNGLRFANNTGNTLNGVELHGDLNLNNGSFNKVQISNGLTLRNEANTGNGVANLDNTAILAFAGTQTFNNATVNVSSSSGLTVEQSGATLTLGSGVLVQGAGGIGAAQLNGAPVSLINQGILRGNVSGQSLTIGNSALTLLTNAAGATIEAVGGGIVVIGASALTNNGTIAARSGGGTNVSPTTLTNSSGGTLTGGTWAAIGSSSTLTVRALPLTTNAAEIIVDGAGSVWRTQNPSTSVLTTLESSLTTNAAGGALRILGNRNYTTANALSNAGTLQLGGGTLTSASLVNTGTVTGFGTVGPQIANQGNVVATGGTLTASNAIQGGTGNITIDGGAALDLSAGSAGSAAAVLAHNGTNLNLGTHDLTVFSAYTNANFGTGNSFNNRANVTGTGLILASGVTPTTAQFLAGDIVGGGTTTGNAVINFGNVHVGTTTTLNYQIGNTNTGGPSLSGAIQTAVNGGSLTDARLSGAGVTAGNWGPVASGTATAPLGVTFNAAASGALTGQVVHIRNNFDNTNSQNLTFQGAAYDFASVANGGITPTPVVLANQRVGGTGSQTLTVTNTAPVSVFSETLTAGFGANSGNATNNGGSITALAPGGSSTALAVGVDTTAAGSRTGSITINLTSNAVNNSGLGNTTLTPQTINVSGNVYQIAQPTLPTSVSLGNVHVGGSLSQGLNVTNTLNAPVGFQEGLNAAVAGTSGAATGVGSITNLAAGSSNSSGIVVGINTATAGAQSGTVTLGLQSNGAGTSGLSPLDLANSAPITVSGNVYNLAVGSTTPSPVVIGNQRIGGSNSQVLTVANVAPGGAFTEVLNASFGANTGNATNNGGAISGGLNAGGVAVGTPNTSAMSVGVNTASAGAQSGTVTLNYVSNGTGTSGLGNTNATVPTQTINVSGNVYQAAIGQLNSPTSLNFGTVQVGQNVQQTLSISNIATGPLGFVEDLGASFGATSGVGASLISGTGSIGSLLAGGTDSSSMVVHVNTVAAGSVNGAIGINYTTNGTVGGVSNGLGSASAGSSSFGVVGTIGATVVDTANPVINTSQPINLGSVRINATSPTALLSVTNQATGNQQAALNASISGNAPVTATGAFNLLAPGSTNNTSLQVGMNTGSAGHITGTATVALVSDASNIGNCSPNCQLNLPSQNVNVALNVYQIAQPTLPTSVSLGNVHVGGSLSQGLNVTNTLNAPVGFQEGLNAAVAGTSGAATGVGSITNLAAGSSNSSGIVVGINTATAGAQSGTVTLGLQSNGAGTSGLSPLDLANSAPITVSGNVYNLAVGSTTPSPVVIGNQRIGGSNSQVLTVANVAPGGAFTEVLNASFGANTGNATNNGGAISGGLNAGGVAVGTPNTSAMSVGVNTASAGAQSGTVTLNYVSNGTGTSGLGNTNATVPTQTINVSGNVYQAAIGQLNSPTSLNFGTVQVGQNVQQTLSISNIATGPLGFVEDLGASFGATSGVGASLISGTGSIGSLLAGGTDSSSMVVHVNTVAAGSVNGAIGINYTTNGTVGGVSNGLGSASAGSSSFGVVGTIGATVVDTANPVINTSQPINLGSVRINATSPTALLSVTNQATGNQQAALNASISGNAPVTATGAFNLLAPGSTNNTSLQVGMNTGSAGHITGTATVALVSDASNIGNCSPNCQLNLPSQNVNVALDVYRLANPQLNTSALTLAGRVGGVGDTSHLSGAVSITNSSPDAFTEGLTVTRGTLASAPAGGFTGAGAVTNLAAQGTSSAIQVSLNTAAAGSFSGSQALNYVSTGAGTTGAPDAGVGSGSVALTGHVYTPAVAQLNTTTPVDFSIVHVGDTVHQALSVSNGAAVSALNDTLLTSFSGATTGVTGSGNLGANGLAAGAPASNALSVGLDTSSAHLINGTATFATASHDAELTDLALANLVVAVTGTVNNYAVSAYVFGSGAGSFSQDGDIYTLDLGSVQQGSNPLGTTLFARNAVAGPADLLDGLFSFLDTPEFNESFNPFTNLAASTNSAALLLSLNTATLGSFSDSIVLHGTGHNASGYSAAVHDITLIVRGEVRSGSVPEPGALALVGLGLLTLLYATARRRPIRTTRH